MMTLLYNIRSFGRAKPLVLAAAFVLFLAGSPGRASAQTCEPAGVAMSFATSVIIPNNARAILGQMVNNLTNVFWTFYLNMLRMQMGQQDQTDWTKIFAALNKFWAEWQSALKLMTMQLSAATVDETEKLGFINDMNNFFATAQDEQKQRIRAKLNSVPTEQACRFDTNADYLAKDRAIGEALQRGFEWDFVSAANNEAGSIGQDGPANLQNGRWKIYQKHFCDYQAEDCDSGCSPPGGSSLPTCTRPNDAPLHKNMDIFVSHMLFKNQTLAVEDPINLMAMQSMMLNVTGFKVPDPILAGAVGTGAGIDQMFVRREYMAKMSAVGSLLYSVVADRMQGVEAKEPTDLRKMMGITYAFDHPSVREIRQSIIEQLWDPKFYKDLGSNPATVSEKELFLKAYGLTMLYDIIAKQEKISTAIAIETAAVLEDSQTSTNLSGEAPVNQ